MTAFSVLIVCLLGLLLMMILRHVESWWATILRCMPLGLLVAGCINQVERPSLPMLFGITFCILAAGGIFWDWFVRVVTPQREGLQLENNHGLPNIHTKQGRCCP